MRKIFVLLLIVTISLSSCNFSKIQYVRDYDNVISIQIVRLDGVDIENDRTYLYTTIGEIKDIEQFISRFQNIAHEPEGLALPIGNRPGEVVFRFEFDNGDVDYVSAQSQTIERSGEETRYRDKFDVKQFYSLITEYLSNMETHKFYLMHDNVGISSIQIVKSFYENNKLDQVKHEELAKVENAELFLSCLNVLNYQSANPGVYYHRGVLTNKEMAVKITYENGDYEVFSHNSREEYRVGDEFQYSDAYIGVFDYEQFYSLLFEYTQS